MSRFESTLSHKPKSKRIGPLWRGVGCVMLLALTLGAYWLAGVLLKINQKTPFIPFQMPAPNAVGFTVGPIDIPVGIASSDPARPPQGPVVTVGSVDLKVGTIKFYVSWIQLATTAVVDVLAYALMVIVYSLAHPVKLGPLDAPPVRRRKGRPKNLTS